MVDLIRHQLKYLFTIRGNQRTEYVHPTKRTRVDVFLPARLLHRSPLTVSRFSNLKRTIVYNYIDERVVKYNENELFGHLKNDSYHQNLRKGTGHKYFQQ